MNSPTLYVGLKAHVVAIDKSTGSTLWSTKLKSGLTSGSPFVTLLVDGGRIYAHSRGELVCLDAATGQILWRNELAGLGYEIASIAIQGSSSTALSGIAAERQAQAINAAGSAAAGTASS